MMIQMNKTPLQIIQAEKKSFKAKFQTNEKNISENVNYLRDNWGNLLMNTAINHVKDCMGVSTDTSKEHDGDDQFSKVQSISKIASFVLPIAWDFLQPLILKYTFRKIKEALFGNKKKK